MLSSMICSPSNGTPPREDLSSWPARQTPQFFDENHEFSGNPENPWKSMVWAHFGYPGWMLVSSREEWVKLEKSENLMRGGAVGAPEARNKLGMLVVMSLQLSMAIGGV